MGNVNNCAIFLAFPAMQASFPAILHGSVALRGPAADIERRNLARAILARHSRYRRSAGPPQDGGDEDGYGTSVNPGRRMLGLLVAAFFTMSASPLFR